MIAEEDLPCVIVQPGGVYGPDDHSAIGKTISDFVAGRMPLLPFPDLGMNMVHVDDVADGILLALDKGVAGQAYEPRWPDHDDARADRHRRRGQRQEAAAGGDAHRDAQGDDAGRARWSARSWASGRTCAS